MAQQLSAMRIGPSHVVLAEAQVIGEETSSGRATPMQDESG